MNSKDPPSPHAPLHDRFLSKRTQMVDEQLARRGIRNPAVLEAMRSIPRHLFVGSEVADAAYLDRPLPTAAGQTISQPFMVAVMTQYLDIQPGQRVLEIGSGSGYQAAILAHLGARVVSMETVPMLAQRARENLGRVGLGKAVTIVEGDGTLGWRQCALYDRVIVTAGAPRLPVAYQEQLGDPGRIVIPIGGLRQQWLTVFHRRSDQWTRSIRMACQFVPLIGREGWQPHEVSSAM